MFASKIALVAAAANAVLGAEVAMYWVGMRQKVMSTVPVLTVSLDRVNKTMEVNVPLPSTARREQRTS